MVAHPYLAEAFELDEMPATGARNKRGAQREVTSRMRYAQRARYDRRRGGRAALYNGAHRRRNKQTCL